MRVRLFEGAAVAALVFTAFGSAGAAQAQTAGSGEVAELTEIVVTGEKTARSLQDTVSSVAVITAERLQQEAIVSVVDLYSRTPNVASASGRSGFSIRGINSNNVSGGGGGGLASVYVDGAVLPRRSVESGPLELWDIQQVEILRGPQSTLQGRNALAGAIVIRTADPTFDFTGKARVTIAEGDQQTYSAALGGPIIPGELAFRVSAEVSELDGFIYNTTRKEEAQAEKNETYRAKLLWTPSAIEGLKVQGVYNHFDRGFGDEVVQVSVPRFYDNRTVTSDFPTTQDNKGDIATVEASYEVTDNIDVTGVLSYNQGDFVFSQDVDRGPAAGQFGVFAEDSEAFTQELRVNFKFDRFEGLIGGYHAKIEYDSNFNNRTEILTSLPTLVGVLTGMFGVPAGTANLAAQTYAAALPVIPVRNVQDLLETTENYALFADGTFHVTDKLSIVGGFRYDREEFTQSSDQRTTFDGTFPNPANFGQLGPLIGGLNQVVAVFVSQSNAKGVDNRTFKAFLPKLGVRYEFTDDLSLAAQVQRGYRSGGSILNASRATVVAYDQEYTTNYELSFRSAWLDNTMTLNANAFYIDWKDQQVNVNLGRDEFDTQVANAGASHLYGFEVEMAHRPASNFDYYVGVGYTRTKFDSFDLLAAGTLVSLTGSEFSQAPRWSISAGANVRFEHSLVLNLNAAYRSASFGSVGATAQSFRDIDQRTVANGKFGYDGKTWGAFVFVNNMFDAKYNNTRIQRGVTRLGAPRVLGAMFEAKF